MPGDRRPVTAANEGRLVLRSDGLYLYLAEQDGRRLRVSDKFEILGNVSDREGGSYGVMVAWHDDRGRNKQQLLPLRMYAGQGYEVCAQLLDRGLRIEDQGSFFRYVWERGKSAPKLDLAERTGWFDDQRYVLPDEVYGEADNAARIIYAPRTETQHYFRAAGTLEEWREYLGERCAGNSRLVLSVCCAFAGPLLRPTGGESGGIHLRGATSLGKSTAQLVAGSVVGGGSSKGFVRSWHATLNGLEVTASQHNDCLLLLDELSQIDSRDAVKSVYLLANDAGKSRQNSDGTARPTFQWRLMILSSGEIGFEEHAGVRTKGGTTVRMLDIDADAAAGMGLFEDLHGAQSPKDFANQLRRAAVTYYGAPYREYLRLLGALDPMARLELIRSHQQEFLRPLKLEGAAAEVGRAASRMSLLAAAGEIATDWDITGWPEGEASAQVKRCFDFWLVSRGGKRAVHDEEAAVGRVRETIERYGDSRFESIDKSRVKEPTIRDRLGFRRRAPSGSTEYLFLPETFQREVCDGFDYRTVLKALESHGLLKREGRNWAIKTTVSGDSIRVYRVFGTILKGGEA
jgi:uncharacterized protein (DUF927 family)